VTGSFDAALTFPLAQPLSALATADVNGSAVRFLVDTGATAVALTANDARRLGLILSSIGIP
jgi:clan AA aspartic protease (TIGR02281 family)